MQCDHIGHRVFGDRETQVEAINDVQSHWRTYNLQPVGNPWNRWPDDVGNDDAAGVERTDMMRARVPIGSMQATGGAAFSSGGGGGQPSAPEEKKDLH